MPARTRSPRVALVAAALTGFAMLPGAIDAQTLDEAIEHHLEGRLERALVAYHAVAVADLETDPVGAGIAHNNACMILLDRGEYESARRDCEAARPLLEDPDFEDLQAQNLNNLGAVNQHLGRFEEAERDLQQALTINRGIEAWEGATINLANLGALATVRGQYGEALDRHLSAERLASDHDHEPWATRQLRIARLNQGVVWEKLGEHRRALEMFRGMLDAADEMLPRRAAAVRVNVGVIYRNLGDPVRASAEIRRAIAEYREVGDQAGLSNALLNLGLVQYLSLGELSDAESSVRSALSLSRQSGAVPEEVQDLFYLGWILLASGDDVEAQEAFRQCQELAESVGSAEGQWSASAGLARIQSRRGNHDGAMQELRRAMDQIETLRSGLDLELRAGFFGDKRPIYAEAIDTLWQLHERDPDVGYDRQAYAIAQRAKARTLLDALGAETIRVPPAAPELVQERLGTDLLLEYFLGPERAYLWVLRRDDLAMVDLGPAGTLRRQVRELLLAIGTNEVPAGGGLAALGERLIGPAEAWLQAGRRLRVAPDGILAHVPFGLLPSDRFPAIVGSMIVSMIPSGSMLTRDRVPASSEAAALRFLGFADAEMGAGQAPEPGGGRAALVRRFDLGPLPNSSAELANGAAAIGGNSRLITGAEATEAEFRASTALGSRVLHVAAHAILDSRSTGGSAIVLTPDGSDDGLLHSREVAGLELRADLAVLAACRTARGSESDESGVGSLTGAFLAAGADSVVATLWDVDDAATAALMQQFYYFLGRGFEVDVALQRAQLRLIEHPDWNRPQVWAAFVVAGQGDTVVRTPGLSRWSLWAAIAGVLALAGLARLRRR